MWLSWGTEAPSLAAHVLAFTVSSSYLARGDSPSFDLMLLDCDGSEPWVLFRQAYHEANGQCNIRSWRAAVAAWESIDWDAASEHLDTNGAGRGAADLPALRLTEQFHSVDKQMEMWIRLATMLTTNAISLAQTFANITEDGVWMRWEEPVAYVCPWQSFGPFGVLMVQNMLLQCICKSRSEAMASSLQSVRDNLFGMFEVLLDFPAHTLDWLESTSWNVSSFDVAVSLRGCDPDFKGHISGSFDEHVQHNPLQKPFLPSWKADLDPALAWATHFEAQAKVKARWHERAAARSAVLTVAMLNLHDAGSWDEWQSLLAAMRPWLTAGGDNRETVTVQPSWFFTRIHALTACPEGKELEQNLVVGFDKLRQQFTLAQKGQINLAGFRQWLQAIWGGHVQLREADMLVCSEAFVLCPLLDRIIGQPMIGRFNMALLNEYHFGADDLEAWWMDFYGLVGRRDVFVSVASRATAEQVYHQTGIRFPYVPYLAVQLVKDRQDKASTSREILLFHNNRPALLAFRDALRLFFQAGGDAYKSLQLRDMNMAGRTFCRPEMAAFRAAVLMPHAPNAIRLIDLYALGVLIFVPGEPMIHKYVWNNRGFAGHESPHLLWRRVAPDELRLRWRARTQRHRHDLPDDYPQYSPFNHLHDWSLHKRLDARRYWLQYTEWASLPGLQYFTSIGDLLARLLALDTSAGGVSAVDARQRMKQHHDELVNDALGWWKAAATVALQPRLIQS